MSNGETRSNPSGRLFGRHRAVVVNNAPPEGLHLAQVRLLVLWDSIPDADLPWAEYSLPLGARPDEGEAMPVKKGDHVWVEFPYSGDSRLPLIVASAYTAPGGKSHLPADLFAQTFEHKRTDGEPAGPSASYGDKVTDLFGVLQQLTQSGDWCLTHKSTGTALHVTKDGHLVFHCEGDSWRTTKGNVLEAVQGNLNITVKGNLKATVDGDATVDAKKIALNGGKGVVTGDHICAFTGSPHSDCSSTVTAQK